MIEPKLKPSVLIVISGQGKVVCPETMATSGDTKWALDLKLIKAHELEEENWVDN